MKLFCFNLNRSFFKRDIFKMKFIQIADADKVPKLYINPILYVH